MPHRFCCYARPTSSFPNTAGQLSTGAANDSAALSAIDDFPVPGGQVMLNNMGGAMAHHCPQFCSGRSQSIWQLAIESDRRESDLDSHGESSCECFREPCSSTVQNEQPSFGSVLGSSPTASL